MAVPFIPHETADEDIAYRNRRDGGWQGNMPSEATPATFKGRDPFSRIANSINMGAEQVPVQQGSAAAAWPYLTSPWLLV